MKIKIPYELNETEVDLPKGIKVAIAYSNKVSLRQKETVIKEALGNPCDCAPFVKWVEKKRKILFIINDASRPTPTYDILKGLCKEVNIEEAKYIIATGAHKAPTDSELIQIFGEFYDRIKPNILIHNARNKKNLKKLGITDRGTEVWINKEIVEAEALIPIGSVEPHYFAGFTGGRKSFFPGLAGYITIEQNHKLALEEGAAPLCLSGNPVHLDLLDALEKIPDIPIFSIQAIVKDEQDLCAVFCGSLYKSFLKASEYAGNIFSAEIKGKADVVITVARSPLDKNLYQAHKAIENGKLALKRGGILILVAECRDGIGPDNFYKLLSSSTDCPEILKEAKSNYKLGYHKAARIAKLLTKAKVWVVSEIEDKILEDVSIRAIDSLQEAVNQSISKKGKDAKILIFMDGTSTVPKVM
jgi:nickel-dependent lactate racemase